MSAASTISEIEAFTYCCNYDCCERLELDSADGSAGANADLYYDDGFVYCNEACAFAHYYDRKKERKQAFRVAIASQKLFAEAVKIAEQTVKESVAANQEYKTEIETAETVRNVVSVATELTTAEIAVAVAVVAVAVGTQ